MAEVKGGGGGGGWVRQTIREVYKSRTLEDVVLHNRSLGLIL